MLFATPRRRAAAVVLIVIGGAAALLWGCSGGGGNSPGANPPTPLSITTTSLSNGQISKAYSSALAATGGTRPHAWTLTAGTLPAGLALDASTGMISGIPTATAARTPLTFKVTDSGSTVQTKNVTLTLAISPAVITVAVSPGRAGLTVTQALSVSATTNDNAGVTWSLSPAGGAFSPAPA